MNSSARLRLCALACAAPLAFAASASASTAPVVKSVTPMKLKVGEKLTVKGSGFIPGKGKTRVFFVRRGGGTAFARAASATRTKLVVVVPAQLDKVLNGRSARVRIRISDKVRGAELLQFEQLGASPVYAALAEDTRTLSDSASFIISGL